MTEPHLDAAFRHTRVLTIKICKAQLSGNLCDSVFMFGGFPAGNMLQRDIRNVSCNFCDLETSGMPHFV